MRNSLSSTTNCHPSSICRLLAIVLASAIALALIVAGKYYVKFLLEWLELQETVTVTMVLTALYLPVALPISVGYIGLVVAEGYLFGPFYGTVAVVCGANIGLCLAHNVMKLLARHRLIERCKRNELARAILGVMSGPNAFRIVFCSRLTPIPFGLQNAIYALSNIDAKVYHSASFLGLLPAQLVGVYIGTTLKTMQDVLELDNGGIGAMAYVLITGQLILAVCLMVWFGTKARGELLRIIAEAQTTTTKLASFNIV